MMFSKLAQYGATITNTVLLICSCICISLLIYSFGVDPNHVSRSFLTRVFDFMLMVFFGAYLFRIIFKINSSKSQLKQWTEYLLFLILIVDLFVRFIFIPLWGKDIIHLSFWNTNMYTYILLTSLSLIELSTWFFYLLNLAISPSLLFVFSFLFIILLGACLLMLPRATTHDISFLDALFTATSAVCVTGLIVLDTAKDFTPIGQFIIIVLIQIGGIGVMTFTTFFAIFVAGDSSFHQRVMLRDMISEDNLNNIYRTLVRIVAYTVIIELIGAIVIFQTISDVQFDLWQKITFSLFHSISAFCNAGFSTLSGNMMDWTVAHNYSLHTCIAFLIILGGIGFPILFNYTRLAQRYLYRLLLRISGQNRPFSQLKIINVNTKLAAWTTLGLLVVGTSVIFILESNHLFKDHTFIEKLALSFFGAVSPRTAGFNNFDFALCMQSTLVFIIFMMWIGASPMSTGGGIKTTNFALALLNVAKLVRGQSKIEWSGREIHRECVDRAYVVITLSVLWLAAVVFILSITEHGASLMQLLFESVSALSTVGLSLNFTSNLSTIGRWVIILTMFIGRVGLLTFLIGLSKKAPQQNYTLPTENVLS